MADNTLSVVTPKGGRSGSVELPAAIFDQQTNVPLIHQVVTAQLAAARQGTHSTKGRGEVSGSGTKPFKQKGTGRARQGSIRMPQHRGGGIVHGPTPRDYSQRTPKKMIAAALLGILSDRARGERLHVVESFGLDSAPSTKTAIELLDAVATSKNVLVVLEREDDVSFKSVRNLPNVHVLFSDQLNAYDAVVSDDIVFTKAAFNAFVESKTGDKAAAEKPAAEKPAEKPAAEKPAAEKPAAEKPAAEKKPAEKPAATKAPATKAPAAKATTAKAAKTTDEEAAK
jgi:large subunit ribosomal protein L4